MKIRKPKKKPGSTQPAASKAGLAAPAAGSEKGTSAATALTGPAAAGGKTSARPNLISARAGMISDRPTTKLEPTAAPEESEK